MAVRCSGECEDHGRVAVHPDVESRGFKRLRRTQCEGGSRSPAVQNIRASRRAALVPQSPDGTPESIHNFASGSVPESLVPSSAGHVRRRLVVVQSSRTPVVDMTALDTDTDPDTDNFAPADAPPPRVWNEGSARQESDTDFLMSFNGSTGPEMGEVEGCGRGSSHRRVQVVCSMPPWICQFGRSQFGDRVSPQGQQ